MILNFWRGIDLIMCFCTKLLSPHYKHWYEKFTARLYLHLWEEWNLFKCSFNPINNNNKKQNHFVTYSIGYKEKKRECIAHILWTPATNVTKQTLNGNPQGIWRAVGPGHTWRWSIDIWRYGDCETKEKKWAKEGVQKPGICMLKEFYYLYWLLQLEVTWYSTFTILLYQSSR